MSKITIDVRSRTPIFEQLRSNIRALILNGVLQPDEQLPSVRALSAELTINPNTIQKAYTELEREGIIYSLPARGSFVCADISAAASASRHEVLAEFSAVCRKARALRVSREELESCIANEWRDRT